MSQQARITVETSHPIARIRPELYSQFIEPLGKCVYEGIWVADRPEIPQENGMRTFALDALRRLGPAAVRWPGGVLCRPAPLARRNRRSGAKTGAPELVVGRIGDARFRHSRVFRLL